MKPIEPAGISTQSTRPTPVTIADVDAAFRELGSFPRDAAAAARLDAALIAYTHAMKQRAMLPEHLIISVRVAAGNAVPHLSESRITAAIRLCLDHYFPE